jgi:hypothetical protein
MWFEVAPESERENMQSVALRSHLGQEAMYTDDG